MAKQEIESISLPLRLLMGKSYNKYKNVANSMLFLNKSIRGMSKRELLAIIGYFALKNGMVEQPMPHNQPKRENNEQTNKTNQTKDTEATNAAEDTNNTANAKTTERVRMAGSKLG